MINNLYHLFFRKQIDLKLEPYPHPIKWKAFLDNIIIWVSVIGPFSTIPQVVEIWLGKNATGVSTTSWLLYIVLAMVWLFYGIVHKVKPIIINSFLWILMEALIVAGAIIYS